MKSIRIAAAGAVLAGFFGISGQRVAGEETAGVFERLDANGDGVLDPSEMPSQLAQRAGQLDKDGDGKLNAAEIAPVADRLARMGESRRPGASGGAGGARPGEENAPPAQGERPEENLKVGDRAPDFTLPLSTGERELTLTKVNDGKPVVLIFGSLTCPPFRSRMLEFDPIYQKYKEDVEFLMVYTREAHPESTIYVVDDGKEELKKILQTDKMEERMEHASLCGPTLKFTFPTVVDKVDNKVNRDYAGWPSRFVIVGVDGKIAYDGGPGPQGFQPAALESWLKENLK